MINRHDGLVNSWALTAVIIGLVLFGLFGWRTIYPYGAANYRMIHDHDVRPGSLTDRYLRFFKWAYTGVLAFFVLLLLFNWGQITRGH